MSHTAPWLDHTPIPEMDEVFNNSVKNQGKLKRLPIFIFFQISKFKAGFQSMLHYDNGGIVTG